MSFLTSFWFLPQKEQLRLPLLSFRRLSNASPERAAGPVACYFFFSSPTSPSLSILGRKTSSINPYSSASSALM